MLAATQQGLRDGLWASRRVTRPFGRCVAMRGSLGGVGDTAFADGCNTEDSTGRRRASTAPPRVQDQGVLALRLRSTDCLWYPEHFLALNTISKARRPRGVQPGLQQRRLPWNGVSLRFVALRGTVESRLGSRRARRAASSSHQARARDSHSRRGRDVHMAALSSQPAIASVLRGCPDV